MCSSEHDNFITASSEPERVRFLDVLRGLAVLMYFASTCGARCVFALPSSDWMTAVRTQLRPTIWTGLSAADLCYPAFLFVAGVSMALFSDRCSAGSNPARKFVTRSVGRAVKLFAIGVALSLIDSRGRQVAWAGPMQQLAACFLVGTVVVRYADRWRSRAAIGIAILVTHATLLSWFPWNATAEGRFAFATNLPSRVDAYLLPGCKFFGVWDPHGILTILPGSAVLVEGLAVGAWLTRTYQVWTKCALGLAVAGLFAINLSAFTTGLQPMIPYLGTLPFELMAIGIMLFLSSGALILEKQALPDVWSVPLCALGRNSLLAVVMIGGLPLQSVSATLISGDAASQLGGLAPVVRLFIEATIVYLPAHILFRRRLFLTL